MILLEGYHITKLYKEGKNSLLYRGIHEDDNKKVVIKLLKEEVPTLDQLERFKYEYELTKSLEGKGTVRVYGLEKCQSRLAMITEDYGNCSLKELLSAKRLTLKDFLQLALHITEALEIIHQNHIIHKDINPSNILCDENDEEIKIIDFGIASTLAREMPSFANNEEGTLLYISPEQTGRMNRGVDYRTDFYSLGVTFYHMATGLLPFNTADVGELVHFHIAKLPVPPHEIDPQIPETVSAIIMKLLAKTAEERYQSTFGLKEDLLTCIRQLKTNGKIESFTIGTKDVSAQFRISEKLYGREEEIQLLQNAFQSASQERARLILVSGYAGIGKSTLVQELYKPLVEKNGYFISGKFDQFKRNIPYSSLAQAFQEFIQQILTESPEQISIWRDRIQHALGHNAQVVVDVIPILTMIIGDQEPVPTLGPNETQNRFNLVFQNFIRALATEEHPLAIFLDDLQWADLPSLKLLETLLLYPESKHFLIIGAYRDNEVDDGHILSTTLDLLRRANFFFNTIILKPLHLDDVINLLVDTLHHTPQTLHSLAEICYEKTQGNPFFLNQFLITLYNEGLLEFDHKEGGWYWDVDLIQRKGITNNVVELMIKKLKELTHTTQNVLQLAACLGNRFDLHTLALINEKSPKKTADDLWEALQKGLIMPANDSYKFVSDEESSNSWYQFLHDRVQQAAYLLIDEDKKASLHLKIGRLLLQNTPQEKLHDNVQEIVNQINFGIKLIISDDEKKTIAELNLIAGKKAKDSIAYKVALNYFKMGMACLDENSLQTDYATVISLYSEAMETAYLSSDSEEMDKYFDFVVENATNLLDKIKCYEIKILYYTNHHEYEKSIDIILYLLKQLGISIPREPKIWHILTYLIRTKIALFGKSFEHLASMPPMKEPEPLAALRIFRVSASSTYLANPKLFLLTVFQSIILLAKYGNTVQASRTYISYGHILCGALSKIETGYQFGRLSLNLLDGFKTDSIMAQVCLVYAAFISHYHEPFAKSRDITMEGYMKGLETGDIEYAGYNIAVYHGINFVIGNDLQSQASALEKHVNMLQTMEHKTALGWASINLQVQQNLLGLNDHPELLTGSFFHEDQVKELQEKKDNVGCVLFYQSKSYVCLLTENYQQGIEAAIKGLEYSVNTIGVYLLPLLYWVASLLYLKVYDTTESKVMKKQILRKVRKFQKKLHLWSKYAPMNCLDKYYLVEAEYARVLNKQQLAASYYDLSIEKAKEFQHLQDEGLANELAAKFYLFCGKERIGKAYINRAYYCYRAWGAIILMKQIEQRYHHLLMTTHLSDITLTQQTMTRSFTNTEKLDLAAILKTAQSISREIELDSLLKKIISSIMEQVNADKAHLLLIKDDQAYIEASGIKGSDEITVLKSIPILGVLPNSIIQETIRQNSIIVLSDALHDDQFGQDPYIQTNEIKSIVCLPLINQGILSGMLYLECKQVSAFPSEKISFLKLLSSQIIIAIDNAMLYTQKKQLSESYQRFVPKNFLQLLEKPSIIDVKLGDQIEKEMTILICDIRNFTSISEKMTPQENINFVNDYLHHLEPMIDKWNGFIDKFIGDAIIALFSNADDALNAAIDMFKSLDAYNTQRAATNQTPIAIGIGLNSGNLTLGTVGVKNRMQGTVVSNTVHIADATEELTKTYRQPLLITEDTYSRLKHPQSYSIRKLDLITLLGKSIPVGIYEVYDINSTIQRELKTKTLEDFHRATKLFQQRKFNQALAIFESISKSNPEDPTIGFYISQCTNKLNQIREQH